MEFLPHELKAARLRLKLRQIDVALRMGSVDQARISCWERGEKLPNAKRIAQLCDILDIPVERLFSKPAKGRRRHAKRRQAAHRGA